MPADDLILRSSRAIDLILADLASVLENALVRLTAQLDSRGGQLVSTKQGLEVVAELRRQVRDAARREGVPAIAEQMAEDMPDIITEALRSDFPGLGEFLPSIEEDLERFFAGEVERALSDVPDAVAGDLARAVRRGVVDRRSVGELQASIAQALDTSLGRVSVLIERSIRDFHEEGLKRAGETASRLLGQTMVYQYVGPDDGKTRPYCDARQGKYLTQKQADALDPKERFNCRHSLAPLLLEDADGLEAFRG